MKKTSWILFSTALLSAAVAAQTPSLKPDAFANRSGIEVTGAGPFHQLALPMSVYQRVQRSDLGDLRVFNAQGEVVPHALLRSASTLESHSKEISVPMFPINAARASGNEDGDMSIEVRKNADGTLVSIRQSAAQNKSTSIVRGVLLDTSKIKSGVQSLRLTVGQTKSPFHFFSIETSDDLQRWRMLKHDAQLVRLEHEGQRIEKDSVAWDHDAGKYLRILWADPQQAPIITAAAVGVVQNAVNRAPMIWSDAIAPSQVEKSAYDYALPGRMPLEQLRINLAQTNTLAPLQIQHYVARSSRRHEQGSWDNLAHTVVFRLKSPQGEASSPDIVLNGNPENQLRLVVDARSGGIGNVPPTLQVGFVPHILVFLARGEGPYTLAWGAAAVGNAALAVTTLIPGYKDGQKLTASSATLQALASKQAGAVVAATPPEASKPASKGVLWAVLIAGVLVLGGMAWALVRQMKQASTPAK